MAEGNRAGVPDFPDGRIEAALAAWLRLGSSRSAAKEVGIDDSTIRNWKSRRPDIWDRVGHAHEEALKERRAAIAKDVADGLHFGASRIRARIQADPAMPSRDLAQLVGALTAIDATQDRIRRLDKGLPTDIFGATKTEEDLDAELARILAEPPAGTMIPPAPSPAGGES